MVAGDVFDDDLSDCEVLSVFHAGTGRRAGAQHLVEYRRVIRVNIRRVASAPARVVDIRLLFRA